MGPRDIEVALAVSTTIVQPLQRFGLFRRPGTLHKSITRAVRTVQELLGHADVKTTQIYTHLLNLGGNAVRSPFSFLPVRTDLQSSR